MNVLQLVQIHKTLEGGSSYPLLVTAVDSSGTLKKYVLKLFKNTDVCNSFSTAKEIIACELAKEFNLITPDYGIINFDHNLLEPFYTTEHLTHLYKGYKFCSEYVSNSVLYNGGLSKTFNDNYDIANLFAFDNIIINVDRGGFRNKPNLLINDDNIFLIDHEQTLPFINDQYNNPNYYIYTINYQYKLHVAFDYLNRQRNKDGYFDEFIEMLTYFEPKKILHTFELLDKYNIPYGDKYYFHEYFIWLKTKKDFIYKSLNQRFK